MEIETSEKIDILIAFMYIVEAKNFQDTEYNYNKFIEVIEKKIKRCLTSEEKVKTLNAILDYTNSESETQEIRDSINNIQELKFLN